MVGVFKGHLDFCLISLFHEKAMVCPNVCIEVVLKKYGSVRECSGILLKLAL